MNPCSLSQEAIEAIAGTYSSFGVDHVFDPEGTPYRVRGYRNKADRLFGFGTDLCYMDDFDAAWALVYKLRGQKNCRQLNLQLQHMGIRCLVPGEGGDVHG